MTPRIVEIRKNVLKKNDDLAAGLRARFQSGRVFVVNLVSSPGAGKTLLLEKTLAALASIGIQTAALVGDPETDNDARRLSRAGVPVRQIETHGICHLDASMIGDHLAEWNLSACDFLFIENVGNLVCTTSFDLGESLRVVFLAVTEGEDKPLKYPGLFNSADAAVISKIDLAEACDFDHRIAVSNLHAVRPGLPILETSGKTGKGLPEWLAFLHVRRQAFLQAIPPGV